MSETQQPNASNPYWISQLATIIFDLQTTIGELALTTQETLRDNNGVARPEAVNQINNAIDRINQISLQLHFLGVKAGDEVGFVNDELNTPTLVYPILETIGQLGKLARLTLNRSQLSADEWREQIMQQCRSCRELLEDLEGKEFEGGQGGNREQ